MIKTAMGLICDLQNSYLKTICGYLCLLEAHTKLTTSSNTLSVFMCSTQNT